MDRDVLIRLENISMIWEERKTLDNISLDVCRGDFLAVTGPNGGGKTTLLRIFLKLLRPTSGRVIYNIGERNHDRPAIGYLPQKNLVDSRFPITLEELVSSGLLALPNLTKEDKRNRVGDTLELIGLEEHRHKSIGQLSGGQLQRGLFGRAIVSNPGILVLDEPLSYLDKKFERRMYDILESLSAHTTIVLVSHEMSAISGMANRHVIVDRTLQECTAEHHTVHYDCERI